METTTIGRRRIAFGISALGAICGALSLTACQGREATEHVFGEAERRAVEAEVDSATRAFEDAERSRDAERIIAHLAPGFYMYGDGVRAGYDSVAASIRSSMPTFEHFEPGFSDIEVYALGRDAAVVSLTFNDSITTTDGETLRLRGPTTLVWERLGGEWRIIYADADHYPASTPP